MGGGSSEVTPHRRRSVADALAERLPGAVVRYEVGCRIDRGLPAIDLRLVDAEQFRRRVLRPRPTPPNAERPAAGRRRLGAHGAHHVDRAAAARPGRPGRCAVRIRGTLHARRVGAVAARARERRPLRAALDGDVVVDNYRARRGARASTGPAASRSRLSTGPRGRSLLRARGGRVAPLGLLPHHGGTDRRGAAETGRRVRAGRRAPPPRPTWPWSSSGSNGAVGVRGARPARPVAAGPPARAGRGGARRQPPHGGRRQRRLAGRDALGRAGRRGAHGLVPGRGGRRRAGRHPGRAAPEPTGRLPVTFPVRVEDGPTGLGLEGVRYPGVDGKVVYDEGVLVGYRLLRDRARSRRASPSGTASPTGTSSTTRCRSAPSGSRSGSSTRGHGGAPRWCRSTCVRSTPGCAVPTGSWPGS